jgi:hypothetical protein
MWQVVRVGPARFRIPQEDGDRFSSNGGSGTSCAIPSLQALTDSEVRCDAVRLHKKVAIIVHCFGLVV